MAAAVEVFNEVDNVVLSFADNRAAEYWALSGEATWASVRPASPADRMGFSLTDFLSS